MKSDQKIARTIGILFLTAMLSYAFGNGLITAVLDDKDHLPAFAASKLQVVAGALLMLTNSVAVVMIGVLFFPVLEKMDKRLALGYLSSRILESLLLATGLVSLLSLLTVSEAYVKAAMPDSVYFETLFSMAVKTNFWAYQQAMAVLGLGSMAFCYLLWKSKLIPVFMSVLGFTGYGLLLAGALLEFFGYPVGVLLALPGGLFEVGLGIWLILKGFNGSSTAVTE